MTTYFHTLFLILISCGGSRYLVFLFLTLQTALLIICTTCTTNVFDKFASPDWHITQGLDELVCSELNEDITNITYYRLQKKREV